MQKATFTDPTPHVSCRLLYLAKSAFREDVFIFSILFFFFFTPSTSCLSFRERACYVGRKLEICKEINLKTIGTVCVECGRNWMYFSGQRDQDVTSVDRIERKKKVAGCRH